MYQALSKTNHSEYYEDVNLIANIYWGWPLPDALHLRDTAIRYYEEIQSIYFRIPLEIRRRTSSLSCQFLLYKILTLADYHCCRDEFKIPVNADSLFIHATCWEIIAQTLLSSGKISKEQYQRIIWP